MVVLVSPPGVAAEVQLPGHTKMYPQQTTIVEINQEILAVALNRFDPPPHHALRKALSIQLPKVGAKAFRPCDRATEKITAQSARHGFDFRQFRHGGGVDNAPVDRRQLLCWYWLRY